MSHLIPLAVLVRLFPGTGAFFRGSRCTLTTKIEKICGEVDSQQEAYKLEAYGCKNGYEGQSCTVLGRVDVFKGV